MEAEVIQNHENVRNIRQGEAQYRNCKKAQTWWQSGIRPFKCIKLSLYP